MPDGSSMLMPAPANTTTCEGSNFILIDLN